MRNAAMIIASMAMLASTAHAAEPRYDHALEEAAARIAAAKMGDIRGGFSFGQRPQFVVTQSASAMKTANDIHTADPPDDGLLPAVERPTNSFVN